MLTHTHISVMPPAAGTIKLPTIRIKEDPQEFSALNPNQRAFVIAYVENGGNATQAARTAGYGLKNAANTGCIILRKPQVKAAIFAELQTSLNSGAAEAVKTLRVIASNPTHMQSVKAATAILDRAGFAVEQRIKAEVTVKSDDDKIREIAEAARFLGKPLAEIFGTITDLERFKIREVLGRDVFDAEYEELAT